ncbi:glycosyltransferase [Chloroflexota bacterium]
MLYQGIVALLLAVFAVNLILNLKALHRLGRRDGGLPEDLPFISVLIPARNEQSNIATCVESFRRQDYPNFEIIVLDDNSSDDTAAIVERMSKIDPRVRLLRGKPLPKGWAGKPFACHQLASQAKGSWILFTDADTVHAHRVLRSSMAYAFSHKLSLLSGFPLQRSVSLSQRMLIPMIYFLVLSWLPLWWLQGSDKPKPGFSFGQFLFIRAEDYRETGGHEAVKSRIIEDLWLGYEMWRHGKKQAAVDLSSMVSCQMYQGFGQLWEGYSKWTYSVSCLSPVALGILMLVGVGLFVVPFMYLTWHLLPMTEGYQWILLIFIQVAVILLMRVLVDHRFHNPTIYSISHPLGILFFFLSAVYAVFARLTGSGIRWKERLYSGESGID